jgi:hypothetical protein
MVTMVTMVTRSGLGDFTGKHAAGHLPSTDIERWQVWLLYSAAALRCNSR